MDNSRIEEDKSGRILEGGISITPIEVNLKSVLTSEESKDSTSISKPRVQFSDKVQRYPESVPTSPNPLSPKSEENKKFSIESENKKIENGHSKLNGAPQIQNMMSVEHNAPYSAGPHHDIVIEVEQSSVKSSASAEVPSKVSGDDQVSSKPSEAFQDTSKPSEVDQTSMKPSEVDQISTKPSEAYQTTSKPSEVDQTSTKPSEAYQTTSKPSEAYLPHQPSPEWSARAVEPKPLMTNVILNIEMVRVQKESPPEDEDNEVSKIALSLPAYNMPQGTINIDSEKVQSPTKQQLSSSQEQYIHGQGTAVDNKANVDQNSADLKTENVDAKVDGKVDEKVDGKVAEDVDEKLNRNVDEKINRNVDGNVDEKVDESVVEKVAEDVVGNIFGEKLQQIDLTPLLNKQPDTSDIAVKNAEANRSSPLPEGLEEKKDVSGSSEIEKMIEIPVTFENSENIESEKIENLPPVESSEISEILKSAPEAESTENSKKSENSDSKISEEKYVEIPIKFETETFPFIETEAVAEVHKGLQEAEPLPGDRLPNEKLIEIKINFEEDQVSKTDDKSVDIPMKSASDGEKGSELDASTVPPEEIQQKTETASESSISKIDGTSTVNETTKGIVDTSTVPSESSTPKIDGTCTVNETTKDIADTSTVPSESSTLKTDGTSIVDETTKEKSSEISLNSEAVNQEEKLIDIPITFEAESTPFNDDNALKDIHKGISEAQPLPDETSISKEKFIEIPVKFEEEEKSSNITVENEDSESGKQEQKLIEIPVTFESESTPFDENSVVKDIHKGLPEAEPLADDSASGPQEKLIEIPVQFEEDKKEEIIPVPVDNQEKSEEAASGDQQSKLIEVKVEQQQAPESVDESQKKEELTSGVPKLIEVKVEQQQVPESVDEGQKKEESISGVPKVEEVKQDQFSQDFQQPQSESEPIKVETFETPKEQPQESRSPVSPVAVIPPSEPSADGVNYQSSFAKPLFEENKPSEVEKVDVKPDEVVFQSTFARPMSQEPSPTEKKSENFPSVQQPTETIVVKPDLAEKKSEEPVQQGFAKPLLDESDKSQDSSIQGGFAKPLLGESDKSQDSSTQQGFAKPLLDEGDKSQDNSTQQGFAKPLLDEGNKSQDSSIQGGFAKPLLDESNKTQDNSIQQGFAKPLDDSSKSQDNSIQQGFAKPLYEEPKKAENDGTIYQTSFAKSINEDSKSSEKSKPTEISKPQQDSQPPTPQWQKAPTNQWLDSYDDGETIWDKPATGVVRDIPITIQTGNGSSQRDRGIQQNTVIKKESSPPKTFVSSDILYYEVPPEEQKSQEDQQLTSRGSPWGVEQDKKSPDSQQVPKSPDRRRPSDEVELNIQEYEQNLKKNTQEALQLVDKLVESSQKIRQMEREKKEFERSSQERSRSRSSSRSRSVQFSESALMEAHSYRVNPDILKDPNSVVMLPDYKIALADYENGLTLFNLYTKDLKRVEGGSKWRNPQCLIYNQRAKEFFILVEYSENDDGKYGRYILRFNQDLEYMNRVEAPKFIADREVSVFRMCYCHRTGCLYLAASTYASGYLYELSPEDKWTEIYTCRNKIFADIQILAVLGPVTELLVLESTRNYVNIISVYGDEATHVRMLAVCERPGTFCIDEVGHLIVHDRSSSKISFHSRISFLKTSEIALVEHANVQMSAWDGLLAVLCPSKKDLRIYKY